jgi:hypothetical protein
VGVTYFFFVCNTETNVICTNNFNRFKSNAIFEVLTVVWLKIEVFLRACFIIGQAVKFDSEGEDIVILKLWELLSKQHSVMPQTTQCHAPNNTVSCTKQHGVMLQITQCHAPNNTVSRPKQHSVMPQTTKCHAPKNLNLRLKVTFI